MTRNKKGKRILKLAVVVVICFIFCWSPFAIYVILIEYYGRKLSNKAEIIPLAFAILNSLINPFLYFKIMSKIKICTKCRRRDRSESGRLIQVKTREL